MAVKWTKKEKLILQDYADSRVELTMFIMNNLATKINDTRCNKNKVSREQIKHAIKYRKSKLLKKQNLNSLNDSSLKQSIGHKLPAGNIDANLTHSDQLKINTEAITKEQVKGEDYICLDGACIEYNWLHSMWLNIKAFVKKLFKR